MSEELNRAIGDPSQSYHGMYAQPAGDPPPNAEGDPPPAAFPGDPPPAAEGDPPPADDDVQPYEEPSAPAAPAAPADGDPPPN